MMDVPFRVQIRNLKTLRLRHSLRLAKEEFRTFFLLLLLMLLLSCKNSDNSRSNNDFSLLKLYKITFYENYAHDGGFDISSEFIIVNKSGTCIDNIKDFNKLNFIHPILECKLKNFEYCSKGTFDINTQIAPGDTAFYNLTYSFKNGNISSFFLVLENPEKYLDIYNRNGYSEGKIRIIVHPFLKIYHSSNFSNNIKYPLPFHEKIEYWVPHKTPYNFLRYKYDHFYNK